MTSIKALIAGLSLALLTGCGGDSSGGSQSLQDGSDITSSFRSSRLGVYRNMDQYDPTYGESVEFRADGGYTWTYRRTIGTDESPAICSYRITGKIQAVVERNQESRSKEIPYATHLFLASTDQLQLTDELEPGTTANPACQEFQRNWTPEASGGKSARYFAELLANDNIRFHTAGGESYTDRAPRPDDTLDEVYTRVAN